jgi:hypothetical protein
VIQDGDQVHLLVTDDMVASVTKIAANQPEERHA